MSRLTAPPAYVPTLTEIVHAEKAVASDMQELMVQRVLRHASGMLEQRLHAACEQLIREHTQALLPDLLDTVERVVRESVCEAFAQEDQGLPQPSEKARSASS